MRITYITQLRMVSRILPTLLRSGITNLSRKACAIAQLNFIVPKIHIQSFSNNTFHPALFNSSLSKFCQVPARTSTIFTSLPSDVIWEGVTGPKGSTKKRARGKRRVTRPKIDLNRGQRLGGNKEGYLWPGLNAPLFSKDTLQKVQKVFSELNFINFTITRF